MTIRFRGRCRLGIVGGTMAYHTQGRYRRRMGRGRIMVGAIFSIQHCRPMCVWSVGGVMVSMFGCIGGSWFQGLERRTF